MPQRPVDSLRGGSPDTALARWRALARMRLAAERAGFLWQLIGLDERTLCTSPVFSDWTPKDLIAHLAAWDELYASRLRLLLVGREEIRPVALEEHSARLHAERLSWPLERALDAFLSARTDYLDALARAPDSLLRRSRATHRGRVAVRQWTVRLYRHDAQHAQDLRGWRRRERIGDSTGPWGVLLAAIRSTRKELLTVIALVPEEERGSRQVRSGLTLLDAYRDLSTQEAEMRAALDAPGSAAATPQGASWQETWKAFHREHEALLRSMARPSGHDAGGDGETPPAGGPAVYHRTVQRLEHERAITAGLRRSLDLRVPARLKSAPERPFGPRSNPEALQG